jgi:predicted TIM-barrel fold metal-dependent hydrolase
MAARRAPKRPRRRAVHDVHIHIQDWSELLPAVRDVMVAGRGDLKQLEHFQKHPSAFVEFLDEQGVDRAGIVNYVSPDLMGFTEHANEFAARYRDSHPDRLFCYGSVHPRLSKDPKKKMERLIRELKVDALKIHPQHQVVYPHGYTDGSAPALRTIYSMAEDAGLPVTIHTGTSVFPGARNRLGDPIFVDDVAVDFPDLKIVLAHGGRPLWSDTAFFLVRRHKNVYMDLSGIPPRSLLAAFPRLAEVSKKSMFGSDWPGPGVRSIADNITQVAALPLGEDALADIFSGTAKRVFGTR